MCTKKLKFAEYLQINFTDMLQYIEGGHRILWCLAALQYCCDHNHNPLNGMIFLELMLVLYVIAFLWTSPINS